jgi:hypothetical protein
LDFHAGSLSIDFLHLRDLAGLITDLDGVLVRGRTGQDLLDDAFGEFASG